MTTLIAMKLTLTGLIVAFLGMLIIMVTPRSASKLIKDIEVIILGIGIFTIPISLLVLVWIV